MNDKKKLGQEPAFPIFSSEGFPTHECQNYLDTMTGMTKRFYAACMILQGIIIRRENISIKDGLASDEVKIAYAIADELLKQEEE